MVTYCNVLDQPELTCQIHDLSHEIEITPWRANLNKL